MGPILAIPEKSRQFALARQRLREDYQALIRAGEHERAGILARLMGDDTLTYATMRCEAAKSRGEICLCDSCEYVRSLLKPPAAKARCQYCGRSMT